MAKPTKLPEWASGVTADPTRVLEPPTVKKTSGSAPGERVPAQHFNFLLNLLYQWMVYLNGLAGEALTWTAAHIFSSTVSFPGGIIGGPTFVTSPLAPDYRISTPRVRMVHGAMGRPWTVGNWNPSFGQAVDSTPSPGSPGAYEMDVPVESGETVTVTVNLAQSVAVSGGTVTLARRDHNMGAEVNVGSANIANATGTQVLPLCTNHAVVSGFSYYVYISFAVAVGTTRQVQNLKVSYTR